jgi:hypothetical protein
MMGFAAGPPRPPLRPASPDMIDNIRRQWQGSPAVHLLHN